MGPRGRRTARRTGRRTARRTSRRMNRRQSAADQQAQEQQPQQQQPQQQEPEQQSPGAGGASDPYAEVERLGELKEKGLITEEEFAAKKQQLLGL